MTKLILICAAAGFVLGFTAGFTKGASVTDTKVQAMQQEKNACEISVAESHLRIERLESSIRAWSEAGMEVPEQKVESGDIVL